MKTPLTAILTVIFFMASPGSAWQVLNANSVPENSVALCLSGRGLMCGYQGVDGGLLRELNSANGSVLSEIDAPEDRCFGLAREGQRYWFVGPQFLTLIEANGNVVRQVERPYEAMHGLVSNGQLFWTMALIDGEFCLISFTPGGAEQSRAATAIQNPIDIAWDGQYLWITDLVDGFIYQFDPVNHREIDIQPTPMYDPTGITFNQDRLYLIDHGPRNGFNVLYNINPAGEVGPRLLPISRYYDFGIVDIIGSSSLNFALFNVGGETLQIQSVSLLHNNLNCFRLTNVPNNPEIAPGEFLPVTITFSPRDYIHYRDTLEVRSNDPAEPLQTVVFKGLGAFHTRRLGVWPDTVNFGVVRADPWRDGNRLAQIALYNASQERLLIDSLSYRIRDIFYIDQSVLPRELTTAETLWVNGWFTPHRDITYIDTLIVFSNQLQRAYRVIMMGTGSDSVYVAGTALWSHNLEAGQGTIGAAAEITDINGDGVQEVIAIGPTGKVYCLNGFGSNRTDVLWRQDFRNQPFSPTGVNPHYGVSTSSDLNRDGINDVILGSGEADRAVYGIDGRTGRLLWRWDARSVGAEGAVRHLLAADDINGDGAGDPIALLYSQNGVHRLARLNGATGRAAWAYNPGSVIDVAIIDDFTRDGVAELVCIDSENHIKIYNGVDGALMDMFDAECVPPIIPVQDLNGDGWRDLVTGAPGGSVAGWSIYSQQRLWLTDTIEGQDMPEPLQFIINTGEDYNGNDVHDLLLASGGRQIISLDPASGQSIWVEQIAQIASLSTHADNNFDGYPDLLIGTETGLVHCLDGTNGDHLWSFDRRGHGSAVKVFSFDDVDIGGTNDAIAVYSDGQVFCISSAGDMTAPRQQRDAMPIPDLKGVLTPNPFNGNPEVRFTLDRAVAIEISVWDIKGRLVGSQTPGLLSAGTHSIPLTVFNQENAAAGVYLTKVSGPGISAVIRGVYLK